MLTSQENADIFKKAEEVHKISMQYQLAHAIFACNKLVEDVIKNKNEEKRKAIEKKASAPNLSSDECARIRKEQEELIKKATKNSFRVYTEYVPMAETGARVIWLKEKKQMVIQIPKKLLDNAVDINNAWYNDPEAVKTLRRTTAHEIGHIALNVEDLLENSDWFGSKNIVGIDEEKAKIFAEKLLQLRHDRNERLQQDDDLKDAF